MNSTAKVLIPNKEWLVTDDHTKIGAISKNKKGYAFHKNGRKVDFKSLNEVKKQLGIVLFEEGFKKAKGDAGIKNYSIYDYPCASKPIEPVYSVKEKLPLYIKNAKSKSKFCAGFYVIKLRKGWKFGFCPKLITLSRYPYHGPFKTEAEAKALLQTLTS